MERLKDESDDDYNIRFDNEMDKCNSEFLSLTKEEQDIKIQNTIQSLTKNEVKVLSSIFRLMDGDEQK